MKLNIWQTHFLKKCLSINGLHFSICLILAAFLNISLKKLDPIKCWTDLSFLLDLLLAVLIFTPLTALTTYHQVKFLLKVNKENNYIFYLSQPSILFKPIIIHLMILCFSWILLREMAWPLIYQNKYIQKLNEEEFNTTTSSQRMMPLKPKASIQAHEQSFFLPSTPFKGTLIQQNTQHELMIYKVQWLSYQWQIQAISPKPSNQELQKPIDDLLNAHQYLKHHFPSPEDIVMASQPKHSQHLMKLWELNDLWSIFLRGLLPLYFFITFLLYLPKIITLWNPYLHFMAHFIFVLGLIFIHQLS